MRIGIVDNEKFWREKAKTFIKEYYNGAVDIDVYASGITLLKKSKQYDIVFIDVEMEQMDGFETATQYKALYPDSVIMMFTVHKEKCQMGYHVGAFRYIYKTKMMEDITEALQAVEAFSERNDKVTIHVLNVGKVLLVQNDIVYLETDKRNVRVHVDGKEYICTDRIGQIEKLLAPDRFCRCHRSYLVNVDKIKSLNRTEAILENESQILVSARRYFTLKRLYLERKFQRANG